MKIKTENNNLTFEPEKKDEFFHIGLLAGNLTKRDITFEMLYSYEQIKGLKISCENFLLFLEKIC